jgi:hypothetical protein
VHSSSVGHCGSQVKLSQTNLQWHYVPAVDSCDIYSATPTIRVVILLLTVDTFKQDLSAAKPVLRKRIIPLLLWTLSPVMYISYTRFWIWLYSHLQKSGIMNQPLLQTFIESLDIRYGTGVKRIQNIQEIPDQTGPLRSQTKPSHSEISEAKSLFQRLKRNSIKRTHRLPLNKSACY